MKSIKSKILTNTLGGLLVFAIIIMALISIFITASTENALKQTLSESVEIAAAHMKANLRNFEVIAYEVGCTARLADSKNPMSIKRQLMEQKISSHGFNGGGIIGLNGIDQLTEVTHSEQEYFQQALKGVTWISEPTESKENNEITIVFSAPLWQDGNPLTKEIVGVVYFFKNVSFITDMIKNIQIGETGTTYMLDKKGVTIAHPDIKVVQGFENTQELVKTNAKLEKIADIESKMISGKSGFGKYSYNGITKFLAYAPVNISNGWSIAISVGYIELMQYTQYSIVTLIAVTFVLLLIMGIRSIIVARNISKPISQITKRLELMANGDLHTEVVVEKTNDEIQILSECAQRSIGNVTSYIQEISYVLDQISQSNLSILKSGAKFEGDFIPLKNSLNNILNGLNDTISNLKVSSQQVAIGSEQVSASAQALSQGATEQASSIDQLTAALSEISEHIKNNATDAKKASIESTMVSAQIQQSNMQMNDMMTAMQDISNKSSQISKIIKTIEDIAFQTNILALNAAVEAARAGTAGKGFSVVADEVRNLALKSSASAKNTTLLIQETVKSVAEGRRIANDTAISLSKIVANAKNVSDVIEKTSQSAEYQAINMEQISIGVDQISSVVQNNSATAEQSAATSEELSSQAAQMKGQIEKFILSSHQFLG